MHRYTSPTCLAFPLLLLSVSPPLTAQAQPEKSPRISSYVMEVELIPAERFIRGSQQITWRNATSAPTDELRFHLYINAFHSDQNSTFMREMDARLRGRFRPDESGWIELKRLTLVQGGQEVELGTDDYIAPDDGNPNDRTVLRVKLPAPVQPGESLELRTKFEVALPKAYVRTGWAPGENFFVMQWFPKLGVLEEGPEGSNSSAWNCHQYHRNTEFFADFSSYRVEIKLPNRFKVGATGHELPDPVEASGKTTHIFEQDDVHDFAFVASPDFKVYEKDYTPPRASADKVAVAVAKRMGVDVKSFDLPTTKIILMLRPEHDTKTQRNRHFDAVKAAIHFFGLRFGPYPYETITLVDPGRGLQGTRRSFGGGMEYPTLITCGTSLLPHPRRLSPEGVVVHEFGHQYWYGLSANNELEEPWLDEGLNSYSESRALTLRYVKEAREKGKAWPLQTSRYGPIQLAAVATPVHPAKGIASASLKGLIDLLPKEVSGALEKVGFEGSLLPESLLLDLMREQPTVSFFREAAFESAWADRSQFLGADNPDPMVARGWEYMSWQSYHTNSYQRPATLLMTMERLLGQDVWWHFLRTFHTQSRFRHPSTAEFISLLEKMCGQDASEFFRQAMAAGATLDYGIESVRQGDGKDIPTEVIVRRYGSIAADVRIRFRFAKRTEPVKRMMWAKDDEPWHKFTFAEGRDGEVYGRLLEAWVDPPPQDGSFEVEAWPAGVYLIDRNLLNNGWKAEADSRPALYRGLRQMLQVQSQLTFAGLIG